MGMLEDLRAETEAEEAASKASQLTADEIETALLLERKAIAAESRATAEKRRRAIEMVRREKAAKSACRDARAILGAIDLVALFPAGKAPDAETMPGKGVLVLRSPPSDVLKTFQTEVEHKARPLADIYADMVAQSVVDPDVETDKTAGSVLRAFCEAYPNACLAIGDVAAKLGGSRMAADKRGHG